MNRATKRLGIAQPRVSKVSRHRRVARATVLKYKRTRDAQRESALKELATLSQRHRLGY
ncbi:MAG: hypothetical protein ACTS8S_22535 [Giesbergeria sp.]